MELFGAVEGGGSKFICAIASDADPSKVLQTARFETRDPIQTLFEVAEFFRNGERQFQGRLAGLGIGCFGPIELDRASDQFGSILSTPKPEWQFVPVVRVLSEKLDLPLERISWDTDVNAAALGEARWGAGKGADPIIYLTVGTGIGGGCLVNQQPIHGLLHPEIGHMLLPRIRMPDGSEDLFPGFGCPFHDRCWESMASGPALAARLGRPATDANPDDPVWDIEAQYLALGIANCVLAISPRRIVLGGGVIEGHGEHLLPKIRRYLARALNGYIDRPEVRDQSDDYVVAANLRDPSSAIAGALLMSAGVASPR